MKSRILILLTLLFATIKVYSQADWNSIVSFSGEISKKIVSGLDVSFQEDIRLNAEKQSFSSSISTLQLDYALIPRLLKIGTLYSYRYQLNDDEYYQSRHRWALQATFKQKISFDWSASLRFRYQTSYREEYYKEYKVNPKNYFRTKLGLGYNFKGSRWAYGTFAEPFVYLNNLGQPLMDRIRYQVEADYLLGRYSCLCGFARFDQSIQVKQPVNTFMIGLIYKYRL